MESIEDSNCCDAIFLSPLTERYLMIALVFFIISVVLPGTDCKIWSKNEQFSKKKGNIITAQDHDLINKGKDSVGALRYPGGLGTAFRVGSKYVMTALHVVQNILGIIFNYLYCCVSMKRNLKYRFRFAILPY